MKKIVKKATFIVMAGLIAAGIFSGCGTTEKKSEGKKEYKIGVVQLVQHAALDAANKGFVDGLASKGFKDNIVLDQQNAQADQSNLNTITQRFVTNKVDLIAAIATPAAQAAANATKDIPIVATAVTDYEAAKLVKSNKAPGSNVTGTTDMNPIKEQVDLITTMLPTIKTIGVIYSSSEVNSQIQIDKMKEHAKEKGLTVVEATVSSVNDIQQAAQNLVNQGIEAVYVPTDNVVASGMPALVQITNPAKLPVFVGESNLIKDGGLATYSIDYYKLGFQTGEMAAAILKGEKKPADMPIETQTDMMFMVNEKVAEMLNIVIPEELKKKMNK